MYVVVGKNGVRMVALEDGEELMIVGEEGVKYCIGKKYKIDEDGVKEIE